MMTEDDAPTGRLMRHKEKRQTKVWNKSLETLYQDWMGSVSFRRKWWCGKESNKSIGEACVLRALLFCILGFGLLILFVGILFFSACRHIVSVQASKCNKTLPKCILSQCRKTRVDDNKDFLFSASYKLLAASRIVSQVGHEWWQKSCHQATSRNKQMPCFFNQIWKSTTNDMLDWLDFSVEHLPSWILMPPTLLSSIIIMTTMLPFMSFFPSSTSI
jgi:hypothetical protein